MAIPFVERSGLTSAERQKMLDESRKAWEDKSMERWLLATYYKNEKEFNAFVDDWGLDKKNKDLARDMRKVDEFNEKYGNYFSTGKNDRSKELCFHDMNKARAFNEYFDAKVRLSKTIGDEYALSEEDIFNLSRSIKQDIKNRIKNEALSLQLQKNPGYSQQTEIQKHESLLYLKKHKIDVVANRDGDVFRLKIRELLKTVLKDVPLWAQYIGKNHFL